MLRGRNSSQFDATLNDGSDFDQEEYELNEDDSGSAEETLESHETIPL